MVPELIDKVTDYVKDYKNEKAAAELEEEEQDLLD